MHFFISKSDQKPLKTPARCPLTPAREGFSGHWDRFLQKIGIFQGKNQHFMQYSKAQGAHIFCSSFSSLIPPLCCNCGHCS
jgi:hypothetical protein